MKFSDVRPMFQFEECDTGGGCTALRLPCDDGGEILITSATNELSSPTDEDTTFECGRYDSEMSPMLDGFKVDIVDLTDWIRSALKFRA